jgi:alkane 1-monooxygenase
MTPFLLPLIFAFTAYMGPTIALSFGEPFSFLTVFIALVLLPGLDLLIGAIEAEPVQGQKAFFDGVLFAFVPYHLFLIIWGGWTVSHLDISLVSKVGLVLSVGMCSGAVGVTFAHELVHRHSRWQKFLGELILVFVCFGHFAPAHVLGHHKNVGTPEDPATARRGQSLYRFFLQAIPGIFVCSYRLRPQKTVVVSLLSLLVAVLLGVWCGVQAVVFFFAQSFVAIILTETVDYIEHYGLERRRLENGRYETISAALSWDSEAWLTSKILINLQRHADHHLHAAKPYEELESLPDSPKLPTGYAGCLILAFVPFVWRKVMDPRLKLSS